MFMKCNFNNFLSSVYFGKNTENDVQIKNEALNMGAVTPPDKLPNVSLKQTINSYENPEDQLKLGGSKPLTAGGVSAGCAFLAMGLSAVSLLPFIRKR